MTTCLEKMATNGVYGEQETSDEVAQFVYRVLVQIPFKICQLLASEVSEGLIRGDCDNEIYERTYTCIRMALLLH